MKVYFIVVVIGSIISWFSCSKEIISQMTPIPETSKIIFHENNFIYVMDEYGKDVTQITFENNYRLEHVALNHDRTKIVANYFSNPSVGGQSSKLILIDLVHNTVTDLLPDFAMAGNGGVDWDNNGYIYFAGVDELPFPNPTHVTEFQANAGSNDIYRLKFDGSDLENLTKTADRGEADVSVSQDGKLISYMATKITDPYNSITEIWIRSSDGEHPKLLYQGGKDRLSSVHDPELSPNSDYVVFSQVNNTVSPVFPDNPLANTAHDIMKFDIRNNEVSPLTEPGPISIIPDWSGEKILYLRITDKTDPPEAGLATINSDGTGYQLIKAGANVGKWIPD